MQGYFVTQIELWPVTFCLPMQAPIICTVPWPVTRFVPEPWPYTRLPPAFTSNAASPILYV